MAGLNRAGVIKFTHVRYCHDARSPAHQPLGRTGPLTQGGERPVTRRRCDGVDCVAPRCTYSDGPSTTHSVAPDSGAETATKLIIGGAFGTRPDPAFDHANPSRWYVASCFTVVIAAVGLAMLPVHVASYRERGVLRRFAAVGFPRWSFAIAQLIVGPITTAAVREPWLGLGPAAGSLAAVAGMAVAAAVVAARRAAL
jgi:hypothetical protein